MTNCDWIFFTADVPKSDLPSICLCVRTLKLSDSTIGNSGENNLKDVLTTTYKLFRQFIVTSLIQHKLFGIVSKQ